MMWLLAKGYGWNPEVIGDLDIEQMVFWINGIN